MPSCLPVRRTTCGFDFGVDKSYLGLIASGLLIYLSYKATPKPPPLCLVLDDRFDTLNLQTWNREIDLGGFGYAPFHWKTVHFACSSRGIEMDNSKWLQILMPTHT
jgi:hypothetical protein